MILVTILNCPTCRAKMKARKFIIPLFGFSTSYKESPKQSGETRPKAYYATQTQFGVIRILRKVQQREVKKQDIEFLWKEVSAKYSPGGKLFMLNQGEPMEQDYMFALSVDSRLRSIRSQRKGHNNKYGRNCPNKMLQKYHWDISFQQIF